MVSAMGTLTTSSSGISISQRELTFSDIISVARGREAVALSADEDFRRRIERGRETLERKLAQGEVIYGVNTGFGGNARYVIPSDEVAHHQRNLLEFLSCGVGEPLPEDAVRAAILLRANALARGLSAVRLVVIER